MTGEGNTLRQLRGVAGKLTADLELQKDLLQEMLVHLLEVEQSHPGRTPSWYIKSCEFHARNFLKLGRSVDSLKRARSLVPLAGQEDGEEAAQMFVLTEAVDPVDVEGEVAANDIVERLVPQLNQTQRDVLHLLLRGLGVRQIAAELGISHPMVIKHRRKIAGIASPLLQDGAIPGHAPVKAYA